MFEQIYFWYVSLYDLSFSRKILQMTESRLVLVYSEYICSYIYHWNAVKDLYTKYNMHIFPLSMCILSTTWFGVAPPLLQPLLGQSCRGILHWESFLENLGRWITGNPPVCLVRFGSWYPGTRGEWQPGGLVPNKMNSIVLVPWKRRESTENTLYAGNGHMSKKPTFQWFLSCFWGRPKNPSRKFNHKSNSEVFGRSDHKKKTLNLKPWLF